MLVVIDSEKLTVINLAAYSAELAHGHSKKNWWWRFRSNLSPGIEHQSEKFDTRKEAVEWMANVLDICANTGESASFSMKAELEMLEDEMDDIPDRAEISGG